MKVTRRKAADGPGGPFTIGRLIHSSRGVSFTGWRGGVQPAVECGGDGESGGDGERRADSPPIRASG